jgi:hypothetical protein
MTKARTALLPSTAERHALKDRHRDWPSAHPAEL